jgi:SAM-dependent methyltransferase
MKQWYEELFENYGRKYDEEIFTRGTVGECDFLEKEFCFDRKLRILDIGCGTGRHAIELTRRGYVVTGIDLSESQLARAREKAEALHLACDFRRHDARKLPFVEKFDAAIMLCEGGFPLMETDEMNYEILGNAAKALKTGGKFIFTTLNGLFKIGSTGHRGSSFDSMTFRDRNVTEFVDDSGNKKRIESDERYYIPSEITWLLKTLRFSRIGIFGAKLGAFSREHALTIEDFEMLVVAEKKAGTPY